MRNLTVSTCLSGAAAAVIVVSGVVVASPVGAEPSPTPSPEPTATAAPTTSVEPAVEPPPTTSTAPTTSTEPTTSAAPSTSAVPAGAHQVTYTVTTTSDLTANIYYVTADPPSQAAVNDPKYMPMDRTTVGPGSPWTLHTTLNDPTRWAFVSASGGLRVNPEFHCEITVDGQVVQSQQGGSGVQCALRPW